MLLTNKNKQEVFNNPDDYVFFYCDDTGDAHTLLKTNEGYGGYRWYDFMNSNKIRSIDYSTVESALNGVSPFEINFFERTGTSSFHQKPIFDWFAQLGDKKAEPEKTPISPLMQIKKPAYRIEERIGYLRAKYCDSKDIIMMLFLDALFQDITEIASVLRVIEDENSEQKGNHEKV